MAFSVSFLHLLMDPLIFLLLHCIVPTYIIFSWMFTFKLAIASYHLLLKIF